eukprot:COSAG02_NODE_78_length_40609_cov_19.893730_1_plen_92_part_10
MVQDSRSSVHVQVGVAGAHWHIESSQIPLLRRLGPGARLASRKKWLESLGNSLLYFKRLHSPAAVRRSSGPGPEVLVAILLTGAKKRTFGRQ